MKNQIILNKSVIILFTICLIIQLTGCGDAEPYKKINYIPHKPIKHDENLANKLKDSSKNIEGVTLTNVQLAEINPELAGFQGDITVYAFAGRSESITRPIIVLTQSIFGQDLTHSIDKYISSLDYETKSKNSFILIRNLKVLPDTTNFFLRRADDPKHPRRITLNRYKDLKNYSSALFSSNTITLKDELGSVYYNSRNGIYNDIHKEILKSFNILSKDMHLDPQKIAIVAFDPFISLLSVFINETELSPNYKLTDMAIVAPVLGLEVGSNYPLKGDNLQDSDLNLGYKIDIVKINNQYDSTRNDLAFDVLRVGGEPKYNFFKTILLGTDNHKTKAIQQGDTDYLYKNIKFYVALGNDSAKDAEQQLKGQKLILDENVTNQQIGLYSMIENAQENLQTTTIQLSQEDHNFPAQLEDADKLISSPTGLLRHIVEQSK